MTKSIHDVLFYELLCLKIRSNTFFFYIYILSRIHLNSTNLPVTFFLIYTSFKSLRSLNISNEKIEYKAEG